MSVGITRERPRLFRKKRQIIPKKSSRFLSLAIRGTYNTTSNMHLQLQHGDESRMAYQGGVTYPVYVQV